MTHCHDFFRKWKRDGNFCGLRKQDAREMDSYLTLVERISNEKTGLNADLVFDKFTAGAARPIIRCKDAETETKALNYVIACLKRGEDVTGGDLQATINGFMGKVPKPPAQMRTPEPATIKESLPVAPVTLGELLQAGDNTVAPAVSPDLNAISDSSGEVSPISDKHVHPGPAALNPIIINDTYRESPFRTGADILHAMKTGIAGEMYPHIVDANKIVSPPKVSPEEQKRIDKQRRIDIAEQLVEAIGRDMPDMVRDIIREHPTWNAADVLYFGVQVLHERKGRV